MAKYFQCWLDVKIFKVMYFSLLLLAEIQLNIQKRGKYIEKKQINEFRK